MKIAERFGISLQTVYKHIANIHSKLNISSRQELLLKVYESRGA
jgi:DNA-binding CsgD family transcriptional regulator